MTQRLPDKLKFDQRRYQQILLNLLSNAVKYSNQGMIIVKPLIILNNDGEFVLRTAVQDPGIGLTEQEQEKIFTPFALLNNERRKQQTHCTTGIGLSICKQICLKLGGDLTVNSEIGHGSVFTFSMSVSIIEEEKKRQKKAKKPKRSNDS